jgi:hypothetical protein
MEIDRVIVYTMTDEDPDLSWLDQTDADMGEGFEADSAERKAAYAAGDWEMLGIVCEVLALIDGTYSDGTPFERAEIIAMSSVWGVESDADSAHLQELAGNVIEATRRDLEMHHPTLTFDDDDVIWEMHP